MLDFRKVLLAAVAGLGLVATASAQITCANTVTPTSTPTVAVEGLTEALDVITLTCTPAVGNSVTVTLTSNVPFTNSTQTAAPGYDITATANTTVPTAISASTITIGGTNNTVLTATFTLGSTSLANITFTGLRVNANAVPSSSIITLLPGGVAGGGIVFTAPAVATVANVLTSQVTPTVNPGADQTVCGVNTSGIYFVTSVSLQENFASAFKTKTQYGVLGGTAYTQGTRLAITFNNLNANVSYYLVNPTSGAGGGLGNAVFTAAPYNAAPYNIGATASLNLVPVAGATGSTAAGANAASVGKTGVGLGVFTAGQLIGPLTVTNGSATVYLDVQGSNTGVVESASIPLVENVPTPGNVTSTSATPVTMSSQIVGVTTGYAQFTSTAAPTIAPLSPATGTKGLLNACSTTLLFPYVVNTSGFDTGMVITNATTGVTGTTAAAGGCTVTFYGSGAPTSPYSTGVLASGSNTTLSASAQAPGLNGYAVAVCAFQGAHGYAFIFSGAGTPSAYAADYLAVVLSTAGATPTTVAF